jgi:hypothetical protein
MVLLGILLQIHFVVVYLECLHAQEALVRRNHGIEMLCQRRNLDLIVQKDILLWEIIIITKIQVHTN